MNKVQRLLKRIDQSLEEIDENLEPLWEMANIVKKHHKELPSNFFISQRNNSKQSARIKIQTNYSDNVQPYNMCTVTIEDNPEVIGDKGSLSSKDIDYFIDFVKRNKNILLDYWDAKIEIEDVLASLVY